LNYFYVDFWTFIKIIFPSKAPSPYEKLFDSFYILSVLVVVVVLLLLVVVLAVVVLLQQYFQEQFQLLFDYARHIFCTFIVCADSVIGSCSC
jgi:hypothetical protein